MVRREKAQRCLSQPLSPRWVWLFGPVRKIAGGIIHELLLIVIALGLRRISL